MTWCTGGFLMDGVQHLQSPSPTIRGSVISRGDANGRLKLSLAVWSTTGRPFQTNL